MSEEAIGKTVRFTLDASNPPELTHEQRQRLESMRDEDIDLSDIPSQAGKPGWRPGILHSRAAEMRQAALKEKILIHDDAVAEFFRQSGEDGPAKMNAVLLEYVETHRKSA